MLEFTSNATHMQQVCNKDIDMYRTFFSRDTGECPFLCLNLINRIYKLLYIKVGIHFLGECPTIFLMIVWLIPASANIEIHVCLQQCGVRLIPGCSINSFRGILNDLGKLLEAFKELIKEGLCWFPRLMRWKTSKGEVAPIFLEKSNGYSYSLYGYMDVETKEYYSKESVQWEITEGNRTGTVEQMDANVEAMARDLQEILRIGAEQKRLWEVYEEKEKG